MPKAAGAMLSPGNLASAGWNLAKTGAAVGLTSNPIARGFAQGAKAVVGSDGAMANKSFANKVQDLAGLTDQRHKSIFSRAAEKAAPKREAPPPPPPPPLRDSSTFSKMPSGFSGTKRPSGMNTYVANKDDYKKSSGSGGGSGKSESTDRQQPVQPPNANAGSSKTINNFTSTTNQQVQNTHNQQMNNINNTNIGGGNTGSKDKK